MKSLPPALREKQRYLKIKIHSEKSVDFEEFVNEVWNTSLSYLGSKGTGKANPWIIKNKFDSEAQEGVIKVERSFEEDFRTALTLINEFNGKNGFIKVERVSGSLKKLE